MSGFDGQSLGSRCPPGGWCCQGHTYPLRRALLPGSGISVTRPRVIIAHLALTLDSCPRAPTRQLGSGPQICEGSWRKSRHGQECTIGREKFLANKKPFRRSRHVRHHGEVQATRLSLFLECAWSLGHFTASLTDSLVRPGGRAGERGPNPGVSRSQHVLADRKDESGTCVHYVPLPIHGAARAA